MYRTLANIVAFYIRVWAFEDFGTLGGESYNQAFLGKAIGLYVQY